MSSYAVKRRLPYVNSVAGVISAPNSKRRFSATS